MLVGKLIIIPALGHQNKGKSSFTGSGLFVLMSRCGKNNKLANQQVPCLTVTNIYNIIILDKGFNNVLNRDKTWAI